MTFPDDDNGDVLRRMFDGGDSLRQPRDIDFAHCFPDERTAKTFASQVIGLGRKVSIQKAEDDSEDSWDVIVTVTMVPDHEALGSLERRLAEQAETIGGKADGWGCFRIIDRT